MEQIKTNTADFAENLHIDTLFQENIIDEIWSANSPVEHVLSLIESYFRKTTGRIDINSSFLMAQAEFHVNNLIFLKAKFNSYPNSIISKLLNLLAMLLSIKDENIYEEVTSTQERGQYDEDSPRKKKEKVAAKFYHPDYESICKRKMQEIKKGLVQLNLISPTKNMDSGIYLNKKDISVLVEYINDSYVPFMRLFYHFINTQRYTEDRPKEVVINNPLPVPPLALATMIKEPIIEDAKEHQDQGEKQKIDENLQVKKEEKKGTELPNEDHIETYIDIMNKLISNNDTKKIIIEKIEDLHREVDFKISERQKKLDEKLKEIEDTLKGKKK